MRTEKELKKKKHINKQMWIINKKAVVETKYSEPQFSYFVVQTMAALHSVPNSLLSFARRDE